MAESGPKPALEVPGFDSLARDWITLWQSELAALAADREAQESWQAILALWAGAANAMLAAAPRTWASPGPRSPAGPRSHAGPASAPPAHDPADGRARTAVPPGAAPAAAAPDARDAEID